MDYKVRWDYKARRIRKWYSTHVSNICKSAAKQLGGCINKA